MTGIRVLICASLVAAALAATVVAEPVASAAAARSAAPYGAQELADAEAQRRARAGRPFTARVAFDAARVGERVTLQKLSCRASVRGRVLRRVRRVRAEVAVCTWRLPLWAKGRRLSGYIALRTERVNVRLSFARRVR